MAFADGVAQDVQPYKFTGKELDNKHKIGIYDSHARQQDTQIPRFLSIDSHAESYYSVSPYVYAANNPMSVIDPDGMDTIHVDNVKWPEFDPEEDVIQLDEVVVSPAPASSVFVDYPDGMAKSDRYSTNIMKVALPFAATLSQLDSPVPRPADVAAIIVLTGATVYIGIDYAVWNFSKKARGN